MQTTRQPVSFHTGNPTIGALVSAALIAFSAPALAQSEAPGLERIPENHATSQQGFTYNINNHWLNSKLEWYYNPANQPAGGVTQEQLIARMEQAARKWMDVCNIDIVYKGTTTAQPTDFSIGDKDGLNVVGWGSNPNKTKRAMTYTKYSFYMTEADTILNTDAWKTLRSQDLDLFEGDATRMFGFMLGLTLSGSDNSVMTSHEEKLNSTFMRTLRGDDVTGCVALYEAKPQTNITRVFNWVEASLASLKDLIGNIGPIGGITETAYGGYFRHFTQGDAYVAEYNGVFYYLLSGGQITPVGTLNDLLPWVTQGGF